MVLERLDASALSSASGEERHGGVWSPVAPPGLAARLLEAGRILLVTHLDPDGDALGSLLGLGRLLREQGKAVSLACQGPIPDMYAWLPDSARVLPQGSQEHDLLVCLDCSDPRRMGTAIPVRGATHGDASPLVNIDHHITNTLFGSVNWVDPTSVATCQMILDLADSQGWAIYEAVATCLLTGLATDTRGFRTANVDARAMHAALRLVECGAPLGRIMHCTLDQRPLASIRLWGEAIRRMQLQDGILWAAVTRDMADRWSVTTEASSGLVNFLSGVREARVIVVFTERDGGTIEVGFRSLPGTDVSQVALRLGGGGHPQASGCALEGGLVAVRERVLAEVRSSLQQQDVSHA
jgi:phosphoesterase RecJ-like protein